MVHQSEDDLVTVKDLRCFVLEVIQDLVETLLFLLLLLDGCFILQKPVDLLKSGDRFL